jgi:hypothetical protein
LQQLHHDFHQELRAAGSSGMDGETHREGEGRRQRGELARKGGTALVFYLSLELGNIRRVDVMVIVSVITGYHAQHRVRNRMRA